MVELEMASDVEMVAQDVMERISSHRHLRRARIAYVFKTGQMDAAAKIHKLSALQRLLSGYDLAVVVSKTAWQLYDASQKLALIDHEFCHVAPDEEGGWQLVKHDLEEFAAVVGRHGLWHYGIREMAKAAKPYLEQQTFELGGEQG